MPNVSIIYYSSTGTCHALARAVAEGASATGAAVRLRLVAETAPDSAIDRNPAWRSFLEQMRDQPRATLADLEWADAVVFGSPTRFGNVAAQLKAFLDTTGGLWFEGKLTDKVYAAFTSAQNPHGGQESTLLALYNTVYHYGGIIVPPGYSDPAVFSAGGNPYGASSTAVSGAPTSEELAAARHLGRRVAQVATRLRG